MNEMYIKFNMFEDFSDIYDYVEIINKLERMQKKYKMIVVDINSPGGFMSTLIHLDSVIRKYDVVVTINSADASSAGLFLWLSGDFRFTHPYSSFMLHRESWGMYGKTSEQKKVVQHNEKIYELYLKPKLENIFTEEEILLAEHTEVWLTGQDLIDRKVCLNADQFDAEKILTPMTNLCNYNNNIAMIENNDNKYSIYEIKDCGLNDLSYFEANAVFRLLQEGTITLEQLTGIINEGEESKEE